MLLPLRIIAPWPRVEDNPVTRDALREMTGDPGSRLRVREIRRGRRGTTPSPAAAAAAAAGGGTFGDSGVVVLLSTLICGAVRPPDEGILVSDDAFGGITREVLWAEITLMSMLGLSGSSNSSHSSAGPLSLSLSAPSNHSGVGRDMSSPPAREVRVAAQVHKEMVGGAFRTLSPATSTLVSAVRGRSGGVVRCAGTGGQREELESVKKTFTVFRGSCRVLASLSGSC
mmetsp:Transcript_29168/g.87478  ORF Transcript_29168/g.87478 Transcript_29168/m.87478 type:complete len:228 (-) Transcript_29168:147-830(-)